MSVAILNLQNGTLGFFSEINSSYTLPFSQLTTVLEPHCSRACKILEITLISWTALPHICKVRIPCLLASVGSLLKYNSLETLYPSSFTKNIFLLLVMLNVLVYSSSSNALMLISLLFPHTLVSIINSTQKVFHKHLFTRNVDSFVRWNSWQSNMKQQNLQKKKANYGNIPKVNCKSCFWCMTVEQFILKFC